MDQSSQNHGVADCLRRRADAFRRCGKMLRELLDQELTGDEFYGMADGVGVQAATLAIAATDQQLVPNSMVTRRLQSLRVKTRNLIQHATPEFIWPGMHPKDGKDFSDEQKLWLWRVLIVRESFSFEAIYRPMLPDEIRESKDLSSYSPEKLHGISLDNPEMRFPNLSAPPTLAADYFDNPERYEGLKVEVGLWVEACDEWAKVCDWFAENRECADGDVEAVTPAGGEQDCGGKSATEPSRTKRGRKKRDRETIDREAEIATEWKRAHAAGIYKVDFAKQHKMTLKDCIRLLDRVRRDKSRSDK